MAADYETAVFAYYRYPPSLAAAVIAIVFFLLSTLMHTYQTFRSRTRFFIPMVIGGYFEWVGYIGRALNAQQTPDWTLGPFILQSVLLLVAPALFAATIYMTLGRIAVLCNAENHLLIRARWLTKLFVVGDVLSFLTQASGAGLMAGGTMDALKTGEKIIIAGLFLQVFFFGAFVIVSVIFHTRMLKDDRKVTQNINIPWKKHLIALYVASILIFVRSIYRVIEYIQGNNGYIMRYEWFLYIFDFLLMFAVMVVFNMVHGSELQNLLREKKAADREEEMVMSAK